MFPGRSITRVASALRHALAKTEYSKIREPRLYHGIRISRGVVVGMKVLID